MLWARLTHNLQHWIRLKKLNATPAVTLIRWELRKVCCEKCITILPKGRATVMRQFLITITLVLAVMFSALAQSSEAPDFSGTWVFNPAKSTLAKDTTTKSESIVIDLTKSGTETNKEARLSFAIIPTPTLL